MNSLNFEYTNEDIDSSNKIKDMLKNKGISFEVNEDSNGIHIKYNAEYNNKVIDTLKEDENYYNENINKINRWLGIDKNGIVVNNLQGDQYAEYQGIALQGNGNNDEKFSARFQIFNVTEKPIFIVEKYNEETKKYEDITFNVLKDTRKKILDKMYEEVKNKELLTDCKQYQKDDLLESIIKYQSELLDEDNKSRRKYECKRMYQILSKYLINNIDELQTLFDKSNIISNGWGETISSYEIFKKGFEDLCKKYTLC